MKLESTTSDFTSRLSIILITSSVFLSAFAFELGYFKIFQIPSWMIEVDISFLISFPFRLPVITYIVPFSAILLLTFIVGTLTKVDIFVLRMFPFFLIFLLMALLPGFSILYNLGWFAVMIWFLLPDLIIPAFSFKKNTTVKERIEKSILKEEKNLSLYRQVISPVICVPRVLSISLMLLLYAFYAGESSALSKEEFSIIERENSELVILRAYSTRIICVEMVTNQEYNTQYTLLPADNEYSVNTRYLGQIKPL